MKTKPFDLIAALSGAPVVTRSGLKVLSVGYDSFPILATIDCEDGDYYDATFTVSGRRYGGVFESPLDLLMLDEEGGEE